MMLYAQTGGVIQVKENRVKGVTSTASFRDMRSGHISCLSFSNLKKEVEKDTIESYTANILPINWWTNVTPPPPACTNSLCLQVIETVPAKREKDNQGRRDGGQFRQQQGTNGELFPPVWRCALARSRLCHSLGAKWRRFICRAMQAKSIRLSNVTL